MGEQLQPRTVRGGALIPTTPRSGNQGDTIFRVESMALRGREGHEYWEVIAGERDIEENAPLVPLTGDLELVEGDNTILGTGTLFLSELHIGQFVVVIDTVPTEVLVVKRIISDTEYEAWVAPSVSLSGQTGYRMSILGTVNQDHYTMLWGSLLRLDKGSLLSAGNGVVRINGEGLPGFSLTATPQPQISVYDSVTGNFTNFPLGLDEPTGITAAAVGGGTKGMQAGNYSLVVSRGRSQTVGYGNPSLRVDVTLATNDRIEITFPAMDAALQGQDQWLVWVTPFAATLGADLNYLNGPWFYYITLSTNDVPIGGGTFIIEYLDAEVETNEIVSFNNDAPPQASGVELLNFTPVWWGCRGPSYTRGAVTTVDPAPGPFIAPAKPNNIEAAPTELQFASSPPETLIGAVSAQGRIYLLTPNHLEIAQATPDQRVPILIRPFWKDGFSNPYQLVFVNGNLYGFTVAGPTQSIGDGDEIEAEKSWAGDVSEITDPWTMNSAGHVLVAYSPSKDAICFFHAADELNDEGFWTTKMLMYGLPQRQWIGARTISRTDADSIVSGVTTVGEKLLLTMGGRRVTP